VKPTPEELAAHIRELAEEHSITVTYGGTWRTAECWPSDLAITTPEPVDPATYLVALHEIGHLVDVNARAWSRRRGSGALKCEGMAWAWAAANCRFHLTARDWDIAGRCFRSYLHQYAGCDLGQ